MSSTIIQSPNVKVLRIFKYCKDSFAKVGMNVSFPKNTDPQKTYKWRYIEHFIKKTDEWRVSDDTIIRVIDAIVEHAKKNNQLNKGLALLASDDILEIGLKSINEDEKSERALLEKIKSNHDLIITGDLLGRSNPKGLPNIVKWYIQGKIIIIYLALSKKCYEAMIKLNVIERSMLPNGKELAMARLDYLKDTKLKYHIRAIMGDDWRKDVS